MCVASVQQQNRETGWLDIEYAVQHRLFQREHGLVGCLSWCCDDLLCDYWLISNRRLEGRCFRSIKNIYNYIYSIQD